LETAAKAIATNVKAATLPATGMVAETLEPVSVLMPLEELSPEVLVLVERG
jgi:hypothetical protein